MSVLRAIRIAASVYTVAGSLLGVLVAGSSANASAAVSSTWTVATEPTPIGNWQAVGYADGQWVVLGHSSDVATSTNASTWTEHTIPNGNWQTVTYGEGRFVALSSTNGDTNELTSTNGTSWTPRAGPSGTWSSVTYGDGRFVAVSSLGLIAMSTNGVDWSTTFSRRFDHFTGVAYGNGRFVAVDNLHGDTLESSDGIHWAFYPVPIAREKWGAVVYGNGNFVAFDGSGGGEDATTDLGYQWVPRSYSPAQQFVGATFGCNTFVATGEATGSTNDIFSSANGVTWNRVRVPTDASSPWTSVGFGVNRFVAVDAAGNIAWSKSVGRCGVTIPTPPQQVSGNIHNGEVWTYMHPSAGQGGSPVTNYRVTITGDGTTKTCDAPVYFQPNCIVTGLHNRVVYEVVAQAHNRYGYSLPTDSYFVIPVRSWSLAAMSPTPVVLEGSRATIQVTGIQANSQGFYPFTVVTVHAGASTLTCHPSPFGECQLAVTTTHAGALSLSVAYTGYGISYRSSISHVWVAAVSDPPATIDKLGTFTIRVHGGPPRSSLRVTVGSGSFVGRLSTSGAGLVSVTAPSAVGIYAISIDDDGVLLERPTVTVTP